MPIECCFHCDKDRSSTCHASCPDYLAEKILLGSDDVSKKKAADEDFDIYTKGVSLKFQRMIHERRRRQ